MLISRGLGYDRIDPVEVAHDIVSTIAMCKCVQDLQG